MKKEEVGHDVEVLILNDLYQPSRSTSEGDQPDLVINTERLCEGLDDMRPGMSLQST